MWFTLEIGVRLVVSPNKWVFIRSPVNIIDLIATFSFYTDILLQVSNLFTFCIISREEKCPIFLILWIISMILFHVLWFNFYLNSNLLFMFLFSFKLFNSIAFLWTKFLCFFVFFLNCVLLYRFLMIWMNWSTNMSDIVVWLYSTVLNDRKLHITWTTPTFWSSSPSSGSCGCSNWRATRPVSRSWCTRSKRRPKSWPSSSSSSSWASSSLPASSTTPNDCRPTPTMISRFYSIIKSPFESYLYWFLSWY